MVIHFFTFSDARGGSSRQRAFRVADKLRERGFSVVLHEPPVLSLSRTPWPAKGKLIVQTIRALFTIHHGDIVYLQRAIANKYFFVLMVAYLLVTRRRMIFDFDDPVYLHSFLKTKIFSQLADVVIVCTHGQKEWALRYNKKVHILHIALDHTIYAEHTHHYRSTPSIPVIGWVGSGPEHVRNLAILAGVFRRLLKEQIPFQFVLIGAVGSQKVYDVFSIPGLNVRFVDALDWTDEHAVPREIQKFDIGVIPHQHEGAWNESKSSFKVLEYMACGVATVCSRFGEMPYIIDEGMSGFLPRSEDEWVAALKKVLADPALRSHLGQRGQEKVRALYSFDAIIPQLERILLEVGKID